MGDTKAGPRRQAIVGLMCGNCEAKCPCKMLLAHGGAASRHCQA
eukprot:CAMPEP_0171097572 /NCGR_PEP_ID=MMETSP0766_2-20121228/47626_1 /TAXON_ID=439317 /ORGANISM="Gambierdiscus australes, Strain CAWD 149" /LENGTH=43 /DNA_ID= /DNA_START= /DNA_END= /DNA_ORIENTATION=